MYEQGAKPPHPKFLRQYFYTIDEHGQLFMHDAKVCVTPPLNNSGLPKSACIAIFRNRLNLQSTPRLNM